ncbi:MAG: hypothetical protein ACOH1R_02050 [Luteimonas sp.]
MSKLPLIALLLIVVPCMAAAQSTPNVLSAQPPIERATIGNYIGEPGIPPEMLTGGFLSAHPDIRWRREGAYSYNRKEYDIALDQFLRAARYADKPSQAMIAEMYWKGIGGKQDRELGYVWMDLAAERMYPNFVIKREQYWQALDATQRRNAVERGQSLLAEYGDGSARPRMEKVLRQAATQVTGSRTGFVNPGLKITPMTGPLAGTGITISADKYYAPEYWRPTEYFAAQDAVWAAPERQHQVRVGELEQTSQVPAQDTPPEDTETGVP